MEVLTIYLFMFCAVCIVLAFCALLADIWEHFNSPSALRIRRHKRYMRERQYMRSRIK